MAFNLLVKIAVKAEVVVVIGLGDWLKVFVAEVSTQERSLLGPLEQDWRANLERALQRPDGVWARTQHD